jgi:CRISPR-associated protein Csb3
MTKPELPIRVNVDVTNPGQFFACCGLLELADRLWPGAEGWFQERQFFIGGGSIQGLLKKLADTQINSSLTDEGLRRLGTLLSAAKAKLTQKQVEEKERLRDLWRSERLHLAEPFDLWLDWWRTERGDRTELKTWAAKQFALEIARPLLRSIKTICTAEPFDDILFRTAKVDGLPFYFDSDANSQNTPRDTGFGLYTLRNVIKTRESTRPLLELCAFFGMQRFRPSVGHAQRVFRFTVWSMPLPPSVAAIAACRMLALPGNRSYEFRLLDRSEYMKAFLPAKPYQGE